MKPTDDAPVVIIGAGLSGLACAHDLSQRGIPALILEAGDKIAGPWRRRHPALRLNIHRKFARLPGLKPPRKDGFFLRRDTVVEQLETYAKNLDVPIRFGTKVTGLNRVATGWQVETDQGLIGASHVVIATGRENTPHIPNWPGRETFDGEFMHSADLGDVSRFDGKYVLVVGAGNSGSDVLNHLARHNPARVLIAVRHGPSVVPMRLLGFPMHRLAPLFAALPKFMLDGAFKVTERLLVGNLKRYGLRSHPVGGGTRLLRDGITFAMDDGFVKALKSGWFKVVSHVTGFEYGRVKLAGGGTCSPDVVIAATGYRTALAPLLEHLDVLDENGQPKYPMGQADPQNPGLWFTGFKPTFYGFFHAAGVSAGLISESIAADAGIAPLARKPGNQPRIGQMQAQP